MGSTRFPGKMLAPLGGRPLFSWAYQGARACGCFDVVAVATDSKAIAYAAKEVGAPVIMTEQSCESGTDRLVEVQSRGLIEGEIWICWQGDEPFIGKEAIAHLLQSIDQPDQEIWTLKKLLEDPKRIASESVVKVVTDIFGNALYFSRSPIPSSGPVFEHVGLYAYRNVALEKIGSLAPCPLERAERLEQLRFLYHRLSIRVHKTDQEVFSVDTKEELAKAEMMCYN